MVKNYMKRYKYLTPQFLEDNSPGTDVLSL